MKFIYAIILTFSLNVYADTSGEITGQDSESSNSTQNGLASDCEKALMNIALADKAPKPNQAIPIKDSPKPADALYLPKSEDTVTVAAVSSDPFGSPCRFR